MQTIIKTEKTTMPLTSSEPTEPMTKRLKPHPDQDQTMVHCPRCDSTNTKFCYYNNYSLSQPRYFCKSCRRYWTKGGTLRNIPIGGVSRKQKKLYNHIRHQKPQQSQDQNVVSRNSIALQLSYPESSAHYSKLDNGTEFSNYPNFMFENLTIDFMESGGGGGGGSCSGECEGGDNFPLTVENGYEPDTGDTRETSPFEEMMTYYHGQYGQYDKVMNVNDVKPRLFDFDWRDQTDCHSDLYDSGVGRNGLSGYIPGLGSTWAGLMNGYGSSSANPLV